MRLVALVAILVLAGCGTQSSSSASASPRSSPIASPSPTPTPSSSPIPTPSPTPLPSPGIVPAWAVMQATCTGAPAAQEALLTMQGSNSLVLADVTNPLNPHPLCTLTGTWQPQLVTQRMVSWSATQGSPGTNGASVIATLDVFSGISGL